MYPARSVANEDIGLLKGGMIVTTIYSLWQEVQERDSCVIPHLLGKDIGDGL